MEKIGGVLLKSVSRRIGLSVGVVYYLIWFLGIGAGFGLGVIENGFDQTTDDWVDGAVLLWPVVLLVGGWFLIVIPFVWTKRTDGDLWRYPPSDKL